MILIGGKLGVFKINVYSSNGMTSQYVELDRFTIGRSNKSDLVLKFDGISRKHLSVFFKDNEIWVSDEGSANGTCVGDVKIVPNNPFRYQPGIPIKLGTTSEIIMIERVEDEKRIQENDKSKKQDLEKIKLEALKYVSDLKSNVEEEVVDIRLKVGEEAEAIINSARDEKRRIEEQIEQLLMDKMDAENQVGEIIIKCEELRRDRDRFFKEKKRFANEMKEIDDRMDSQEDKIRERRLDAEKELNELKVEKKKARAELESSEMEKKLQKVNLEVEIEETQTKKTIAENDLRILEAKKQSVEKELENVKTLKVEIENEAAEIINAAEENRIKLEQDINRLNEKKSMIESKIGDLQADMEEANIEKMKIKTEMDEFMSQRMELERAVEDCREENDKIVEDARNEMKKIKAESQALESEAKLKKVNLEVEFQELISRKASLGKDISRLSVDKENLLKEINSIRKSG